MPGGHVRSAIVIVVAMVCSTGDRSALRAVNIAALPQVTREEIIATAKRLATHKWTCRDVNLRAQCIRNYDSNWHENQEVTGIAYGWGHIDDPENFEKKLAQGYAAGAHSRHGIASCTAGIDCSGFVEYCWGLKSHLYSTSNLRDIAGRTQANVFEDLKPGDALVKPGDHVVLFAGYNPDGTINVYEASGSASRVIYHKRRWSELQRYFAVVYKGIVE
jgi:cell wall-associated NlpC family hydrolase